MDGRRCYSKLSGNRVLAAAEILSFFTGKQLRTSLSAGVDSAAAGPRKQAFLLRYITQGRVRDAAVAPWRRRARKPLKCRVAEGVVERGVRFDVMKISRKRFWQLIKSTPLSDRKKFVIGVSSRVSKDDADSPGNRAQAAAKSGQPDV